jgi:hypothetical protein
MRIVLVTKIMVLSLLLAVATGATAVAQGSDSGSSQHGSDSTTTVASHETETVDTTTSSSNETETENEVEVHHGQDDTTTKSAELSQEHQARLSAVKLKVCENRHKSITNIMSRISDRGQKQLNLFSTIATRTEAFYINKGKTLSNYDTLVTAVNDKKAAAQTTVDAIKADSASFSCSSTDPQGSIAGFKTALKTEIQALKDYKTAVKNLIVGVKSVQSTTTTDNSTEAN